jgi:ribose transport system substrate-binding protein
MNPSLRTALLTTGTVLVLAISGCQSDSTSAAGKSSDQDVAAAQKAVDQYSKAGNPVKIDFPPVTDAASKLRGKRIFYIPILTAPPLFQTQSDLIKRAAEALDMSVTICNGNSNPADITSCFNQAASSGAAGIMTDSIPPGLAPQAYQSVVDKKIPTVALNINQDVPAEYTSMVSAFDRQEVLQSAITADQIIADSEGTAEVLLVAVNDSEATTNSVTQGIDPEFKKNCPGCVVNKLEINSSQFGNVPSLVSTGLVQHPNTDYVYAQFDVVAQGAVQGVTQQQKAGHVKVVSVNGTLGALQGIDSGAMFANTGSDINYEAWGAMDMLVRQLLGQDPLAEEHGKHIPIRTYTKETMKDMKLSSEDYESGVWFGDPSAYEDAFKTLWGVK